MVGLLLLPIPFALAGSAAALRWLWFLAGTATFLTLVNLAARLFGRVIPVVCVVVGLGLAGLVVVASFPNYVVTDTGVSPRYWPDFFRAFAFGVGAVPLAAYERVPAIRERWRRRPRRKHPPMC